MSKILNKEWFLYIILTEKNKLYTGITRDLIRRFNEHLSSPKKKAKFFRSDRPVKVLLALRFSSQSKALKKEFEIKKMSRLKKLDLINHRNQNLNYQSLQDLQLVPLEH